MVKLLAEGGFSFVYLVEGGGEKFALKKVLSQLPEQSELAKWEIQVSMASLCREFPRVGYTVMPDAGASHIQARKSHAARRHCGRTARGWLGRVSVADATLP